MDAIEALETELKFDEEFSSDSRRIRMAGIGRSLIAEVRRLREANTVLEQGVDDIDLLNRDHAIERHRLTQRAESAEATAAKMREALEFYGTGKRDWGKRAHAALDSAQVATKGADK